MIIFNLFQEVFRGHQCQGTTICIISFIMCITSSKEYYLTATRQTEAFLKFMLVADVISTSPSFEIVT